MDDYTLHPMIRPGAFVQIDDEDTRMDPEPGDNEFERPIYFFQLRDGYAYGWCRLDGKVLSILPHSLSPVQSRQFVYPDDIDVLGRVVAAGDASPAETGPVIVSGPDTKRISVKQRRPLPPAP